MKFHITGNLNMKKIKYGDMKIHKRYLFTHELSFGSTVIWNREYIGIVYKQNMANEMIAHIQCSYDYIDKNEPHTGHKTINHNMNIYEMVPQGQISMEERSFALILHQYVDENLIIENII